MENTLENWKKELEDTLEKQIKELAVLKTESKKGDETLSAQIPHLEVEIEKLRQKLKHFQLFLTFGAQGDIDRFLSASQKILDVRKATADIKKKLLISKKKMRI